MSSNDWDAFEIKNFDTAEELMSFLRPSNDRWSKSKDKSYWQSNWIFRGQANSDWQIAPTAWRDQTIIDLSTGAVSDGNLHFIFMDGAFRTSVKMYSATLKSPLANEHLEHQKQLLIQAYRELILINQFIEYGDRLGFKVSESSIPNNDESGAEYLKHVESDGNSDIWLKSAIALAQHHGVPTRLIDWTYHPFVAAFFAIEEIIKILVDKHSCKKKDLPNQRIAVYAINKKESKYIKTFTVRRSENNYLHSQHGLFTYDISAEKAYAETGKWISLNQSLSRFPKSEDEDSRHMKLTLPALEAKDLLRLLYLENITGGHLKPTYDHVAQTMLSLWKLMVL